MATYIVGDLQGCLDELLKLLEKVQFNPTNDTLYLAGDLVARGPKSLETLRFIHSLGSAAKTVLGNHDLHLLAVSRGISPIKEKDKTAPIFSAPDRDELLTWLRHQPLLIEHDDFTLSHAGISPQWDLNTARQCANEVEHILQSKDWGWLLENMYSNTPDQWDEKLKGIERYRYTINALTRMRFCFLDGRLDMACKMPPTAQLNTIADSETDNDQETLVPWFVHPQRIQLEKTAIFGHWAALMGYEDEQVIGLDTGCVWGGPLTLLRWEDKCYFTQPSLKV